MTQPLLFSELEFNAENLKAWAESVIVEEPTTSVYSSVHGEYITVPYTVEDVLRDVLSRHYYANYCGQKSRDLADELVDLLLNGVPGKLPCDMNADELAATIVVETQAYDLETMDDFLDSSLGPDVPDMDD